MRAVMLVALLTACGEDGARAAQLRRDFAIWSQEQLAGSGSVTIHAAGAKSDRFEIGASNCDLAMLRNFAQNIGDKLAAKGFVAIECRGGQSLAIGGE